MEATVIVIGGGVAGLTAALELSLAGIDVLLIEKYGYPRHKVCGEYVSNEVYPYLESLGLFPSRLGAVAIDRLQVSAPSGKVLATDLDSGGFGLSRYALDQELYRLCKRAGTRFLLDTSVSKVDSFPSGYHVTTSDGLVVKGVFVVGAYGKRSALDVKAARPFTRKVSPFLAVKYHIRFDHAKDFISLHNFDGGYCGMSAVEGDRSCLCYLTSLQNLKKCGGSLTRMEQEVLGRNPHLREIFSQAQFLYEKPLVISEISFSEKSAIEGGMLMTGDSAGLIAPLCGNGMAMAIHSAKILAGLLVAHLNEGGTPELLSSQYAREWDTNFSNRLRVGRMIQHLFGSAWLTEAIVSLLRRAPKLARHVVRLTHGIQVPV
jgi:flavin-dependent dehydrogenase